MTGDTDRHSFDAYALLARAYLPDGKSTGVHKLSIFLEKQVRFAAYLGVSVLIGNGESPPPLPRMAGLGAYLTYLYDVCEHSSQTEGYADIGQLLRSVAQKIQEPVSGIEGDTALSLKQYRDYLAHGGVEPSGRLLKEALLEAVNHNSGVLRAFIQSRGGISLVGDGNLRMGTGESLCPLVLEKDGSVAMFQDTSGSSVVYYSTDVQCPRMVQDIEDYPYAAQLSRLLARPPGNEEGGQVRAFHQAIHRDLVGFAQAGEAIEPLGIFSPFKVSWVRKTSAGPEGRIDEFRVDTNNSRQWRSGTEWLDYADFLRSVANWDVIIERSLVRLLDLNEEIEEADRRQFFSSSKLVIPPGVRTRFAVRDVIGASFGETGDASIAELRDTVDDAAGNATGAPQIFFVTGEAGIGKTHNLFVSSLDRAKSLASNESKKPLYLYVSCSGVGLKTVKDLINAAVVDTQNLNFQSVLALCRNGMIVLIIDGFDELLGGAGYKNAFELLAPTLKQLGGSGTLLLSARSSYFSNQYQASIDKAAIGGAIPAHHLILELKRWGREEVAKLFGANSDWKRFEPRLGESDLALLGVPFFSHAFHEYISSGAEPEDFSSLRSILIDSYLDREARKLGSPGIVSRSQLRAIYLEIAGLLFEGSTSTLDLDDFKFACASALEVESFSGKFKELGDRLTVLCGMSAAREDEGSLLFSFQHDVFREVLLADYLAGTYLVKPSGYSSLIQVLSRDVLGDATVETLVDGHAKEIEEFISPAAGAIKDSKSVLSANVAALISAYIDKYSIPPSAWFANTSFATLDLVHISDAVNIRNCRIDRLILADESAQKVTIVDSEISSLDIVSHSSTVSSAPCFSGRSQVVEFTMFSNGKVENYASGRSEVVRELVRLGATGLDDELRRAEDVEPSSLEIFAEDVLTKFASRRENSYVVESRSRLPGDGANAWMRLPHDPRWASLTDTLEQCGLVEVRPITSSGPAKLVVAFTARTGEVADRDSVLPAVIEFWKLVHAKR